VAYRESLALKRQEELLREEEEDKAESGKAAERSAAERERRARRRARRRERKEADKNKPDGDDDDDDDDDKVRATLRERERGAIPPPAAPPAPLQVPQLIHGRVRTQTGRGERERADTLRHPPHPHPPRTARLHSWLPPLVAFEDDVRVIGTLLYRESADG
jgi:hypothetical protein